MNPSADIHTPRKVYVELTTKCNLDCEMCIRHSWQQPGGSMSRSTFQAILQQLTEWPHIDTVHFGGYGEPLVHPDIHEFLDQAKRQALRTELVTNGTLLDPQTIERLVDLPLDKLIVSVDGISEPSRRHLHPGSFAAFSTALLQLYERKRALHSPSPDVWLEFVATRKNIHELPRLKARATVLGFSGILVTNLIPHSPELTDQILYQRWSTLEHQSAAPSPYNPCVDLPLLDACPPASNAVGRLRDASTHLRLNGADISGGPPRCPFITQGRFAIRFDGRVSPCLPLLHTHTYYLPGRSKDVIAFHLGNVSKGQLEEIWCSDVWSDFRERVQRFEFSACLSCGGCDLRESNRRDCTCDVAPRCSECLWAMGLVQCP